MARFDLIGRIYDHLPIPTHARAVARRLEGVEGVVLDIGGGTGKLAQRISGPSARVVVVDLSRGMLARARRARRDVDGVQASAARLPFAAGSVAGVVATEAFHHFGKDQNAALDDVARVLRPGGTLVMEEVDPGRWSGRAVVMFERVMRFGSVFHEPDALVALVGRHLRDVTWERTGRFTYLVVAKR